MRREEDRRQANWKDATNVILSLTTRGFTRQLLPALPYLLHPCSRGHEHDDSLGLINMNARMYDPKLGRFLQPDSIIQHPNLTEGLNRYTYVRNNPLSLVDPSGNSDHAPSAPEAGSARGDRERERPERPEFDRDAGDRGYPLYFGRQDGTRTSRESAAELANEEEKGSAFGLGYGADANPTLIANPTEKVLHGRLEIATTAPAAPTSGGFWRTLGNVVAPWAISRTPGPIYVKVAAAAGFVYLMSGDKKKDEAGKTDKPDKPAVEVDKAEGVSGGDAGDPDNNRKDKKKDKNRDTEGDKPASDKTGKDFGRRIEKELGRDAQNEFHDMKEKGAPDRSLNQLKQDASDLYRQSGKDVPNWLK